MPASPKTTIFLSHASEDKDAFVRPLAEALRDEFTVWYDEYELVLGDSLRQKIDEGLKKCDFGIVVLSQHFFAKRWPKAELDGMFALESDERKIILPVWHGVTVEHVKEFSAILAGRLGVSSGLGVEKVVESIRRAVEVSDRTKEIAANHWKEKFAVLSSDVAHRKAVAAKVYTEEGVREVMSAAAALITKGQERADVIAKEYGILGIRTVGKPEANKLHLVGPASVHMHIVASARYINAVDEVRLHLGYSQPDEKTLGASLENLETFAFRPMFEKDWTVLWRDEIHTFASGDAFLDFAFARYTEWMGRLAK